MPRYGHGTKVEACLLCGQMKCECSGIKKPRKTPRQPKEKAAVVAVSPVVHTSARDRMKAAAVAAGPDKVVDVEGLRQVPVSVPVSDVKPTPVLTHPKQETQLQQSQDTSEFAAAIRALAPLLHPDELITHAVLVSSPLSVKDRAAQWRLRRNNL